VEQTHIALRDAGPKPMSRHHATSAER